MRDCGSCCYDDDDIQASDGHMENTPKNVGR